MTAALPLLVLLSAAPTAPDVTGRWEGDGFVLVLEPGGAGTLADGPGAPAEPMRWKAGPATLAVTQDGETQTYGLRLAGDALTLSGGDLDGPVTLRRRGGGAAKGGPASQAAAQAAPPRGQAAAPRGPPRSAKGTCQGACRHYLRCAGQAAGDAQAECLQECAGLGLDPWSLAAFTALDCPTAVAIVQAAETQAWNQVAPGGSATRGMNNDSQCNGCVRDGNDCIWLSQSNWGTGYASPYSGAAASCDPGCCR